MKRSPLMPHNTLFFIRNFFFFVVFRLYLFCLSQFLSHSLDWKRFFFIFHLSTRSILVPVYLYVLSLSSAAALDKPATRLVRFFSLSIWLNLTLFLFVGCCVRVFTSFSSSPPSLANVRNAAILCQCYTKWMNNRHTKVRNGCEMTWAQAKMTTTTTAATTAAAALSTLIWRRGGGKKPHLFECPQTWCFA